MQSVFSNYLDPLIEEGLLQDLGNKFSTIYEQLSIAYNQGSIGVANCTRFYVPYYEQDADDFDYDLLYYIYSNKQLQELIRWFNGKIIPEFINMSYATMYVRLIIFTRKLNNLVENNIVDKEMAIKIHLNLVNTIKMEKDALMDEILDAELPF